MRAPGVSGEVWRRSLTRSRLTAGRQVVWPFWRRSQWLEAFAATLLDAAKERCEYGVCLCREGHRGVAAVEPETSVPSQTPEGGVYSALRRATRMHWKGDARHRTRQIVYVCRISFQRAVRDLTNNELLLLTWLGPRRRLLLPMELP